MEQSSDVILHLGEGLPSGHRMQGFPGREASWLLRTTRWSHLPMEGRLHRLPEEAAGPRNASLHSRAPMSGHNLKSLGKRGAWPMKALKSE